MSKALGLYGHIRQNMNTSRLLIASFFVACCVGWLLACISYNLAMGFIQLGAERGPGLLMGTSSNTVYMQAGETPRQAKERQDKRAAELRERAALHGEVPIGLWVADGFWFAVRMIFVPILFVGVWFAYFWHANSTLVSWATGAVPASRSQEKRLFHAVETLAIQTGEPMPDIEIIESDAMNAYASGLDPSKATIAVTRGLLNRLTEQELRAVLAHEYTHILNRDSRVMVIASVFVGLFEALFHYFLNAIRAVRDDNRDNEFQKIVRVMVTAPLMLLFAGGCVSFAVCWGPVLLARARLSRAREFLADAGAVELTHDPDALVSALQRIALSDKMLNIAPSVQAMMIFGSIEGLLASHPPIEDRIAALRAYAAASPKVSRVRLTSAVTPAAGQPAPAFGRRPARTPAERKRA